MSIQPIGIFDSGIGGLSVLQEIRGQLPHENIFYLADQAHVPYGPRPIHQVRAFAEGISHFLLDMGVKTIVVACNTASAAALYHLRNTFPDIPFVGMEPAIKPAAESTISGVVGVLATPATFQGELYASVVSRFANGVEVLQDTCPGLVSQIENGDLSSIKTRQMLREALAPMLKRGIDRIVMGCTHYPFVIPIIEEIVGPQVEVIDPAPAVARQTRNILTGSKLLNDKNVPGQIKFMTTANPGKLKSLLVELINEVGEVQKLNWDPTDTQIILK